MKNLKKISVFVTLVTIVALASSCNRGVGCPTNFQAEPSAVRR